jgi:hypothetical protein
MVRSASEFRVENTQYIYNMGVRVTKSYYHKSVPIDGGKLMYTDQYVSNAYDDHQNIPIHSLIDITTSTWRAIMSVSAYHEFRNEWLDAGLYSEYAYFGDRMLRRMNAAQTVEYLRNTGQDTDGYTLAIMMWAIECKHLALFRHVYEDLCPNLSRDGEIKLFKTVIKSNCTSITEYTCSLISAQSSQDRQQLIELLQLAHDSKNKCAWHCLVKLLQSGEHDELLLHY